MGCPDYLARRDCPQCGKKASIVRSDYYGQREAIVAYECDPCRLVGAVVCWQVTGRPSMVEWRPMPERLAEKESLLAAIEEEGQ